MKTLILEQPGRLVLADTPQPTFDPKTEALVRVHRVGVCGTDLHAFHGRQPFFSYPRILGHELGVEIVEIGPNDRGLEPGDRCAVEPYLHCGRCVACRRGAPNCCLNLKVMGVGIDGGMREFVAVPLQKLHRANSLSWEQLALVETLCIGAHAVYRADPKPGELVLVVGAGPIGLSVLEFVQLAGCTPIVMDTNPKRLAFCREKLHVAHTIDATQNPLEALLEISKGELATVVFDATGNPNSMMQAFRYVAHSGKLVFVGLFQGDVTFNDPDFHRRETTLLATRNARPEEFMQVIRLFEAAKIAIEPWVGERAKCEEVPERFLQWTAPDRAIIKPMIVFD
jgi:2-desacetyl-2-hydroxyethyl bacteriochlorophyllide A dehydrogenase